MNRYISVIPMLIALAVSSMVGCSTKLLTRFDYQDSLQYHRQGDAEKALASFPKGERGNFITTMEKTALGVLSGNPEINGLARYAKKVDNAVRFKVSREIQGFFYLETPEGYYPSEHEVVWMHMLLCLGYLQKGQKEKAYVEARKSANLLSTAWSDEGHFDDPFLRVLMGGLWTMLGQWDEARVDFRRAAIMEPRLAWAKQLAARDAPPKELVLVLGGPGPEPGWNPRLEVNPIRGARGIEFVGQGLGSDLSLRDSRNREMAAHITPDSSPWYRRHFVRNNEIGDLIKDSGYAARMTAGTLTAATGVALGVGIGAAIMAGGIGLGGALAYVGFRASSGELIALGIVVAAGGTTYGYKKGKDIAKEGVSMGRKVLDISDAYRYVRFLPEYAWVGWSGEALAYPLRGFVKKKEVVSFPKEGRGVTRINGVTVVRYPDARE